MTRGSVIPQTSAILVQNAVTLAATRSGADLQQTRATMTKSIDRCSCAVESSSTSYLLSSKHVARVPCRQSASSPTGKVKVQKFYWPKATSFPQGCVTVQGRSQCLHARAASVSRTRDSAPTRLKDSHTLLLYHHTLSHRKNTRSLRS